MFFGALALGLALIGAGILVYLSERKPKCYGKYWTVAPTVTNLKKRGCLKCKYWTYEEDSCLLNSPQPPRKKK